MKLDDSFKVGDRVGIPVRNGIGGKNMLRPYSYKEGTLTEISPSRTKFAVDGVTYYADEVDVYHWDDELIIQNSLKKMEYDLVTKLGVLYDSHRELVSYLSDKKLLRVCELIDKVMELVEKEDWFRE